MDRVLYIFVAVASLLKLSHGQPNARIFLEPMNNTLQVKEGDSETTTCTVFHHGDKNSELWFMVNEDILPPGPHIQPYQCPSQEGLVCTAADLSVNRDSTPGNGSQVSCVYRDETTHTIILESDVITIVYVSGHSEVPSNDSDDSSGHTSDDNSGDSSDDTSDDSSASSFTEASSSAEERVPNRVLVTLLVVVSLIAVTLNQLPKAPVPPPPTDSVQRHDVAPVPPPPTDSNMTCRQQSTHYSESQLAKT